MERALGISLAEGIWSCSVRSCTQPRGLPCLALDPWEAAASSPRGSDPRLCHLQGLLQCVCPRLSLKEPCKLQLRQEMIVHLSVLLPLNL